MTNVFAAVALLRGGISDSEMLSMELLFPFKEETIINVFAEMTGIPKATAWREWLRGSDRIHGERDIALCDAICNPSHFASIRLQYAELRTSQILNVLQSSRKEVCAQISMTKGLIGRFLAEKMEPLMIYDESVRVKVMGMCAPWTGGLKGNFLSTTYLFSEWSNGGMEYLASVFGRWLQEIYHQLLKSNRSLGDRGCECEEWEKEMHKILKFGLS